MCRGRCKWREIAVQIEGQMPFGCIFLDFCRTGDGGPAIESHTQVGCPVGQGTITFERQIQRGQVGNFKKPCGKAPTRFGHFNIEGKRFGGGFKLCLGHKTGFYAVDPVQVEIGSDKCRVERERA